MRQEEILKLLNNNIILSDKDISEQLGISDKVVLNAELKCLCDKDEIIKVGQGIYACYRKTKWGRIPPNEIDIVNAFYIKDNNGVATNLT